MMERGDMEHAVVPEAPRSRVRRFLQRPDLPSLLISLLSLFIAACSFFLFYSTSRLSRESVNFQLLGDSSVNFGLDGIGVISKFVISNGASLDLSVVRLYCSNGPIEQQEFSFKYCKITSAPEQFPFLLKAGELR